MTKYTLIGLIFSMLNCTALISASTAEVKGAEQTATTRKFSSSEEAAWHVKEGQRLSQLGKSDDAAVHWREALRLQPNNQDAANDLQKAQAASVMPGVKEAINKYANVDNLIDLANILKDHDADILSSKLLMEYRKAIQEVDGGIHSPDPTLFDDYEDFMLRNGLYGLPAKYNPYSGVGSGYSMSDVRIHGRALLLELARWNKRLLRTGINIKVEPPPHILTLVNGIDQYQYLIHSRTWVDIQGTDTDDGVPLEARFEDGAWRIGAGDGATFHFRTTVKLRYFRP